jgi:broad specificity phosphatase PhoE
MSPRIPTLVIAASPIDDRGFESELREALSRATLAAEEARAAADQVASLLRARGVATEQPPSPLSRRVLPRRIVLYRHGESRGNVDESLYCRVPDPLIPLTRAGYNQAVEAGAALRSLLNERDKVFVYVSPYRRSKQTASAILSAFPRASVQGVREEPQLREQDFGNFQDDAFNSRKAERLRFGRFFFRFPDGESGADVFDRVTLFEDHLVRDIDAGRFAEDSTVVIITHGLALRIFLARWLHWTVAEYEEVWNPCHATPIVLERSPAPDGGGAEEECSLDGDSCDPGGRHHTKNLYRLTEASLVALGVQDRRGLASMLLPEDAWERVLGGFDSPEWGEDAEAAEEECVLEDS